MEYKGEPIMAIKTEIDITIKRITDDIEGKEIKEYDKKGNLIYYNDFYGIEYWKEYDEDNNLIYSKNLNGLEWWAKWDENNKIIYYKNANGNAIWWKYDENNKQIEITEQEYNDIIYTKFTRFEIMEI